MVYGPIVPTSCRHAALLAFSLSFYLTPRVFVPLPLEISLSFSPLLLLFSHSYSPLSLVLVSSLPRARYSVVVSCFVPRVSNLSSRPCPRLGYSAASAKAGNSDRGSKSVLAQERERERESERERERERTDSRQGQ